MGNKPRQLRENPPIRPTLTAKAEAFVIAYIRNGGNGLQAATAAGYKHPHVLASRLLNKPDVLQRIMELQREAREAATMTRSEALRMMERIARNEAGEATVDRLRALRIWGHWTGMDQTEGPGADSPTVEDLARMSYDELVEAINRRAVSRVGGRGLGPGTPSPPTNGRGNGRRNGHS